MDKATSLHNPVFLWFSQPLSSLDLLDTEELTEFSNTELDSSCLFFAFHYINDCDLILSRKTNIHTMNKNAICNMGITFEQEKKLWPIVIIRKTILFMGSSNLNVSSAQYSNSI